MIRINLLPVKAVKKQQLGKNQLILFGLLMVGTLVGNYYWYADRDGANQRLKGQVDAIKKDIADLDKIIGEVKNIAAEKQKLEEKLKVLNTLRKGRTGPVKMLDAMATCIPKNVWLKSMGESNGSMTLDGSAVSNDDLAEYMKSLANVVWTPEGMGRLVEVTRPGATTSRVELTPSGQIKDIPVEQVGVFFTEINLKTSTLKKAGAEVKVVDFQLTLKANYTI
jgi:type IV pilus assembly protein PilN